MDLRFQGEADWDYLETTLGALTDKSVCPFYLEIRREGHVADNPNVVFKMDCREDVLMGIELVRHFRKQAAATMSVNIFRNDEPCVKKTIGARTLQTECLDLLRERFKLKSQQELTTILGVSGGHLSRLFNGKAKLSQKVAAQFVTRLKLNHTDPLAVRLSACAGV